MRVLIVGGYGVFGGRLARLLAEERRIGVVIAGRSLAKAQAFCDGVLGGVRCRAAAFDRAGDAREALRVFKPDLIVDASGPFQAYGEDPYALVKAAIRLGIPYVDLADGAEFVSGIGAFDDIAKAAGVFVLSGASTVPVLTGAAARALIKGMERIDRVEGGISPSPKADVGLSVVRAVAGYAGRPFPVVREGVETIGYGLTESRRFVVRPPGHLPLKSTRFSLVEVPDLTLMPRMWPELSEVWIGAGTRPQALQSMLEGLARLVKWRLFPPLGFMAGLFHGARRMLRFGEHRGGMYMQVTGAAGGAAVTRSWHLIAEGDDGPFIPAMAAQAIILKVLAGKGPKPGARSANGDLDLADYERMFVKRQIFTGRREETGRAEPLYRRVLGEAFDWLPLPIQVMHDDRVGSRVEGSAIVERGPGPLAQLAGKIMKFPAAGLNVPVSVDFTPLAGGGERWTRTFSGVAFMSEQTEGVGRWTGLIRERFGPVVVGLAPVVTRGRLDLVVRRWSVLGVVLPVWLAPKGAAFEQVVDGRFAFDVTIGHPLTGMIVRYRGWLKERLTNDR